MGTKSLLCLMSTCLCLSSAAFPPDCDYLQKFVLGQKYYIYNPGYPRKYAPGTDCFWYGVSPSGTSIVITCEEIDLPSVSTAAFLADPRVDLQVDFQLQTPRCNGDKLKVSLSGSSDFRDSRNYCGFGTVSLISEDNKIAVGDTLISQGGRFLCSLTALENFDSTANSSSNTETPSACDCGLKSSRRIVGGVNTKINEYPSMAGLVDIPNPEILCGANIISDRYLLSAAHCMAVFTLDSMGILVGDWNISTGSDTQFAALYKALNIYVHPKFDARKQINDLAIIKTERKIAFSLKVNPICLPFRFTTFDFTDQNATLLGWGQLFFSGPMSDTLQKVNVDVVNNTYCAEKLAPNAIENSQICTFTPGKDACQSDSGGPLLWFDPRSTRLQQIGVVSYGYACASNKPGVHTRVTSYLTWIVSQTSATRSLLAVFLAGFLRFSLAIYPPGCSYKDTNLQLNKEYYVYNIGYGNNYTAYTDCDWYGESPVGTQIHIYCEDVLIPTSVECKGDQLRVSLSGDTSFRDVKVYCGVGALSLIANSNKVAIGLKAAYNSPGGRFLCTLTPKTPAINCDCGWKRSTRIVGGQPTGVNEYPMMAGLIDSRVKTTPEVICGGTIISTQYVVTAAHCLAQIPVQYMGVLVGDWDITTGADTAAAQLYPVAWAKAHPSFNYNLQINDIAIVKTSSSMRFSLEVGPACLPFSYAQESFTGEVVTYLGYGQTFFNGPTSDMVQKASVSVISNQQCQVSYPNNQIIQGQMCTYTSGKDACQGDSGGPALWMQPYQNRLYLLGVISYGYACNVRPGITARVTSYLDWIVTNTPDANYCRM
ncbi:unnamed protein product [Phyllotreta striolata]|uniref:Venom serine protease 34 n=1 Tax=Phyllotreta striolata TaxID=444603 RepID=A0A9N9TV58_PHYSR|nr:unnamed protein product [Phyllotreta striolata]